MKRIICLLILPLLTIFSFTSCNQNSRFSNYICDTAKLEKATLPDDMRFCGHLQDYHAIDITLMQMSDKSEAVITELNSEGQEHLNIVEFTKRAEISKEEFEKYLATYDSQKGYEPVDRLVELYDANIIYSNDNALIANHFNQNETSYSEETEPTKNFFVIHGALIRHIGYDAYKPYLERVYNTKYDNIVNLINNFGISEEDLKQIMNETDEPNFYSIDELKSFIG